MPEIERILIEASQNGGRVCVSQEERLNLQRGMLNGLVSQNIAILMTNQVCVVSEHGNYSGKLKLR